MAFSIALITCGLGKALFGIVLSVAEGSRAASLFFLASGFSRLTTLDIAVVANTNIVRNTNTVPMP